VTQYPVWVLVQELEKMQDEAEESRRAMHEMKLKFDAARCLDAERIALLEVQRWRAV
jgi:hypothetical protein